MMLISEFKIQGSRAAGFKIQVAIGGGDKKRGSLPWGWVVARKGTAKDVNRHRMH